MWVRTQTEKRLMDFVGFEAVPSNYGSSKYMGYELNGITDSNKTYIIGIFGDKNEAYNTLDEIENAIISGKKIYQVPLSAEQKAAKDILGDIKPKEEENNSISIQPELKLKMG